ncbi:MAG: putative toxin-antitoxin system toxin component, PIN family [Bacteroidetes bacterium]|nr:putative toxin-antitoxin system toxin component, PIN family [Bacteroidota bacterium]
MNVVIDTNVIISGLLNSKGLPGKIINLLFNERINLLFDNRILAEYKDVLSRDKFRFNRDIIDPLIDYIKKDCIYVISNPILESFNDEDDKKFYEVALSGNADYLITGNIKHFPKDQIIVTPREFLEKII